MPVIKFFLQKRIFTFMVIALMIIAGVQSYRSLHVETLPQVQAPVVYVAIPLPGAAPEEIETMISQPVEDKLSELDGVQRMVTSCWENVSLTVLFFNDTVDPKKGFEQFKEKIAETRGLLPAETMEPIVDQVSFENLPMMFLGLSGSGKSQRDLSVEAEKLKRDLARVPGVKDIIITGATPKQVLVEMDDAKLKQYDPSLIRTLTDKLGQINTNMPGGKIILPLDGRESRVRTIGRFTTLDDLRNMTLGVVNGAPVSLKQVAGVRLDYPDPEARVRVMGKAGVTLSVLKKKGYGTIDVADAVHKALDSRKTGGSFSVAVLNDQSASIKRDMGALKAHSIYGTLLVLIVLFIFLGFRVAAVVSTALPLSILMTFIGMSFMGLTIDMVSLFALVLALGMMVDNAIVVCENIFRHIGMGKDADTASMEATDEVGWPILSSTLCTLAAFLPMIMVNGPIGQFTRPIPYVVTFALVSSYIVALCFNPLLSSVFIRNAKLYKKKNRKWTGRVRAAYNATLNWSLDHRPAVILCALAIFIASLTLIPYVGVELFPQTDTSKLYIDVKTLSGTPLAETKKVVLGLEKILKDSGKVEKYISTVGSTGARVEIDDVVAYGSDRGRVLVDLKDSSKTGQPVKKTIEQFREAAAKIAPPGAEIHFLEKALGPPIGPPISIKVSGDDMEKLDAARKKIVELLTAMKLADVKDNFPQQVPQVLIKVHQPFAGALNLTTRDIGGSVFLTLTGYKIGGLLLDEPGGAEETLPIFLKIKSGDGGNPAAMVDKEITLPGGKKAKFSEIADVDATTTGFSAIEHENGRRTVSITANLHKGQLATRSIAAIKAWLPKMKISKDVDVTFGGETMLITSAFGDLKKALFISLIIIYVVLLLEFKSTLQPLIILTCVPYALAGVVLGLLVTHNSFGILSFIGVVCLTGIVVNNAIILIDYANLLRRHGTPLREAVIEAAQTRLRPIVMTKSTVILGVLPLAITASDKTAFWKPLCWSIIWGLIVATTLTLVIIPVVYSIMEDWRKAYYSKRENAKR